MNAQAIANWVQIITSVAVLVGLGLVVFELNQTRTLVKTQLTSDGFIIGVQQELALLGDNPGEALTRACMEPETLTPQDVLLLDRLHRGTMSQVERVRVMQQIAGFGLEWEVVAQYSIARIVSTPFGRAWWDATGNYAASAEVAALGNEVRDNARVLPECEALVTEILSALKAPAS